MNWSRGWQRWVQNPQSASWRKLLLQVHLWVGLIMGLYIVLISVSGSAVVFRREVHRWFRPTELEFGDPLPLAIRLMEWGVDFHDNLLAGSAGAPVGSYDASGEPSRVRGRGGSRNFISQLSMDSRWSCSA